MMPKHVEENPALQSEQFQRTLLFFFFCFSTTLSCHNDWKSCSSHSTDTFTFMALNLQFKKMSTSKEPYNNSIFEKRLVRVRVTTVHPGLFCIRAAGPVSHMTVIAWHLSCITINGNDGNDSTRFRSAPQRLGCSLLVKTETQMAWSSLAIIIHEMALREKERERGECTSDHNMCNYTVYLFLFPTCPRLYFWQALSVFKARCIPLLF